MTQTAELPVIEVRKAPDNCTLQRDFAIPEGTINVEARTVELSFASEEPYTRWWGTEILDISSSAIRMSRLQGGAALLVDHDTRDQVGVIVKAWIGDDRKARAIVRFSRSPRGEEIFQDVQDGIRKLVSVGYRIHEYVLESKSDSGETYRVTDWEPYEVSIVSVPADATVGVGRDLQHPFKFGEMEPVNPLVPLAQAVSQPAGQAGSTSQERTMTTVTVTPPADPVQAESRSADPLQQERNRVAEITALGREFNQRELADQAVAAGTAADQFRTTLLQKLKPNATVTPAETRDIGMSDRDIGRFSFCRALLVALDPNNAAFRAAAGFELECSEAARSKISEGPASGVERQNGIMLPPDVLRAPITNGYAAAEGAMRALIERAKQSAAYRDLVVGTPTAGGNLVATNLLASSFIDLLRNRMRVFQMGATMLTDLSGNVAIPRQTGGAACYWVAESGAPTESQAAFDQVTLAPKTVGAFTDYSRRLLLQSSLDVEAFVRADLAMCLALGIDYAALFGDGTSNSPTGVFNVAGVGSVAGGTNGAAPTWDHAVLLEEAVANANADIGSLAYVTNAKVRSKLKRTQKFSSTNGDPVWGLGRSPRDGIGELNGYDAYVTNQIPSNLVKGSSGSVCSAIGFGNWADLLIGMWGGLDLMLDPYTASTSGGKRLVALQDIDINVRRATSFAVMKDALTT